MRICVFGASGVDIDGKYITATEELCKQLAQRGHSLIFGGGRNGLMGAAVRGFKAGGGHTVGVAPHLFDDKDVLFDDCDEFVSTETMRDRKAYMEDNCDAFIVAPGGIGTYEEFFEALTLKQLARHTKPIVLFNIDGYWDSMNKMILDGIETAFIRPQTQELYCLTEDTERLIDYVENDRYDINRINFSYK